MTIVVKASVAEVVSRVTIGLRVMIAETGVVRGSRPSPMTCAPDELLPIAFYTEHAHSECEILGGEDTAEMLVLVHNQNAISPLGGAELRSIGDYTRSGRQMHQSPHCGHLCVPVMLSGTVSAGRGRRAETVPALALRLRWLEFFFGPGRFRDNSVSIFFLIACRRKYA